MDKACQIWDQICTSHSRTCSVLLYNHCITPTNIHCSCSNIVTCDLNWTQRAFLTKNWGTKGREERTSPPSDCPLSWQRIESIVQRAAQQYTRVTTPQTDLHQTHKQTALLQYPTVQDYTHGMTSVHRTERMLGHTLCLRCSAVCLIKEQRYFQIKSFTTNDKRNKMYCLLTPFTKNVFP